MYFQIAKIIERTIPFRMRIMNAFEKKIALDQHLQVVILHFLFVGIVAVVIYYGQKTYSELKVKFNDSTV
jgi:hypothetical protein